jgi:cell division protein FtsB
VTEPSVSGTLGAAAKAADEARRGITLPGVAVGAGGGAILTALSFQAFLDRMASDLGIGGVVMFVLLIGAVSLIIFLLRFIFIQWRENSATGKTQAAATTHSAIAEAATALELKGLKASVETLDRHIEDLHEDMRNSTTTTGALRDAFTELRAEVANVVRRIDSLSQAERRHGTH